MLSLACPACGAPCRIRLAEAPAISCAHCKHESRVPEPVASRIRAAFRVLSEVGERERQFSGLRRTVASSAFTTLVGYLLVTLAVAAGSALLTRGCQTMPIHGALKADRAVLPTMAAIVTLLISLPTLIALLRSGRKLRQIARALPPLRAGDPSACRVCGAAVSGNGVVRCSFCASDNVVDPSATAKAQRDDAAGLEEEVRAQAAAIGETRGLGFPLLGSLALLPVPFAVVWYGTPLAASIDRAPAADLRLAIIEEGPTYFHTGPHQFCVDESPSCARESASCIVHAPVEASFFAGKVETYGQRRVIALRQNLLYGLVAKLENGALEPVGYRFCVAGEETPQWKERVVEDAEQAGKRREEDAAMRERWKRLFPDAGIPALQDPTLPPIPIGR